MTFQGRCDIRFQCLRGDIPWLTRSLYLHLWEYFPWRYLKAVILKRRLQTTDKLKDFICHRKNSRGDDYASASEH